eukprot:TRINITY_DN66464_c0_g1_i1.p1 TRINITY_DN66464_c0_g1~~TRINITY_DN66464_c0_g1_i1.p1  ORF type:complete len:690 (+),score=90.26 TRINITY_DN66464_c0_g1_i1:56-2125(+)
MTNAAKCSSLSWDEDGRHCDGGEKESHKDKVRGERSAGSLLQMASSSLTTMFAEQQGKTSVRRERRSKAAENLQSRRLAKVSAHMFDSDSLNEEDPSHAAKERHSMHEEFSALLRGVDEKLDKLTEDLAQSTQTIEAKIENVSSAQTDTLETVFRMRSDPRLNEESARNVSFEEDCVPGSSSACGSSTCEGSRRSQRTGRSCSIRSCSDTLPELLCQESRLADADRPEDRYVPGEEQTSPEAVEQTLIDLQTDFTANVCSSRPPLVSRLSQSRLKLPRASRRGSQISARARTSVVSTSHRESARKRESYASSSGEISSSTLSLASFKDGTKLFDYANARLLNIRNRSRNTERLWMFIEEPSSSRAAKCFGIINIAINLSSVFFSLAETGMLYGMSAQNVANIITELIFDIFFTADICVRFYACPNRCGFFFNIFNEIDVLAGPCILITRILLLTREREDLPRQPADAYFLCGVPVLRLFRILRRFEKFRLLTDAFKLSLEALPVLLFTYSLIALSFFAAIFLAEPRDNIRSLDEAIWMTIVTMTTVGYGDVVPVSVAGRVIISVVVVSSALFMAIPLGIIGNAFSHVWDQRDQILLITRTRERLSHAGVEAIDIPDLFQLFDVDQDGVLSFEEFNKMLQEMSIGLSPERALDLFCIFDKDDSGAIDDQEFVRGVFPGQIYEMIYGNVGD